MSNYTWLFIENLIFNLPILIANLTGVVLSIIFRKRIGKAAIFSMIAFLLFFIVTFIAVAHSAWLNLYVRPNYGAGLSTVPTIAFLSSIIRTLLTTIAFAPLFISIFAKRINFVNSEPPPPNQYDFNQS